MPRLTRSDHIVTSSRINRGQITPEINPTSLKRRANSKYQKREEIKVDKANCSNATTRAAAHSHINGWKVLPIQIRSSSPTQLRLEGAGLKPSSLIPFDLILQQYPHKLKVTREWIQRTTRDFPCAEGYSTLISPEK
ncbi:hypothetical protein PsorP6_017796 [Peronosclerospora sorghi]|uniref:Uncharacterized protein n=1 Tax=Peronosclerospora sorghi TaxID=230839 RepID=A0ACC0WLR7_9STRA|nr:hypothetical protein PsorP6_017796 [Peronosclerospora sorghi]